MPLLNGILQSIFFCFFVCFRSSFPGPSVLRSGVRNMVNNSATHKLDTLSFLISENDLGYQYNPLCGLCSLSEVKSGKDQLLYIDSYCYIIKNGNTHLIKSDGIRFARMRLSFTLRRHSSDISQDEEEYVRTIFSSFITECMHAHEGRDFIFAITMGTYPQHWHIHAYFPPWRKKPMAEMVTDILPKKYMPQYQNDAFIL